MNDSPVTNNLKPKEDRNDTLDLAVRRSKERQVKIRSPILLSKFHRFFWRHPRRRMGVRRW